MRDKICLAGCVILQDDKILLLHRIKTGWYELPGGKIDQGEDEEETARRELKEELDCEVEIMQKLGTKDFEEHGYVMTYNWYLAKVKPGEEVRVGEPEKFDGFKYVAIEDLKTHKLSPNMENLAEELISGRIKV